MPGQFRSGLIAWTRVGIGERVGSIGYEADMHCDCGRVRLHYTTTHAYNGEKRDSDYTITLETTSQPFGGLRWWFVCPRSGKRVSELHLPNGAYTFAYRLGYLSQRETPVIAQSLGASNSGIAWADTVESATTFESLNGCARTYERESAESMRRRKSITPICWSLCNGFRRNSCDAALLERKAAMGDSGRSPGRVG